MDTGPRMEKDGPVGNRVPRYRKEPDLRRPSRRGTAAGSFGPGAKGPRRAVSDSARMRENCGWRCHKTWSRSSVAAAGLCPRTSSFRRCSPLGCPGGMTNKVLVVCSEMDRMTTCVSCSGNEPTRRRPPPRAVETQSGGSAENQCPGPSGTCLRALGNLSRSRAM